MSTYLVAFGCVLGMACGQVLFKLSATALKGSTGWLNAPAAGWLLLAFIVYALTSVGWVWVLKHMPLGRAYPLMALAFVLVPLASRWVFGEQFPAMYALGILLIVSGVVIVMRA